jgi:uncharacterized protein YggE
MKKVVSVFTFIILALLSQAQHAGNSLYNGSNNAPQLVPYNRPSGVNLTINTAGQSYGNMVSLKADVMVNVLPSAYIIILSAEQVNESFEMADSMLNTRFRKLKQGLRYMGITDEDVHIDFISLVPQYEIEFSKKKHSITGNEIATGFELRKNIHVRVKNTALVDGIIAAAAEAEIYDLVKVDYVVENMEQIYQQLRLKAIDIIKMKQLPYTETGIKLKQLDLGETRGSTYPFERYASYTAYKAGTPAHFSRMDKKDVVQINYAEKKSTVYYEKVPFGQFDHVINPTTNEPAVQFYFSLQVNYKIVDEEAEKRQKEDRDFELRRREIDLANLKNPPCDDKTPIKKK